MIFRVSIVKLLVFTIAFVGCSRDDRAKITSLVKKKPGSTPAVSPVAEERIVQRDISSSGAGFQVKDVMLLRSSVESCVGPDMLKVTTDMLMPDNLSSTPKGADGRIRFLLPIQYASNDDIIDKERGNLLDLEAGSRTSVSADGLTDTYLRSLETIGNVVAHNCAPNNPNCSCAGKEQALAMMTRCLPGINPNTIEMTESAALLGAICAEGVDGMRTAVASLIASYAFALAR
ncbi:MAG: hypothetical protein FJ146_06050 [Deltaproteobacteria bacterium]|nr:hypothetical protein [Deltaproteobacteria bacterium]